MCSRNIFYCIFKTIDILYGCLSQFKTCVSSFDSDNYNDLDMMEMGKKKNKGENKVEINKVEIGKVENKRENKVEIGKVEIGKVENKRENKVEINKIEIGKVENKSVNQFNNEREQIIKEYVDKLISNVIEKSISNIVKNSEAMCVSNSDSEDIGEEEWKDAKEYDVDSCEDKVSENEEIGFVDWIDNDDTVNVKVDFIEQRGNAQNMRIKYKKCIDKNDKKKYKNMYRPEQTMGYSINTGDEENGKYREYGEIQRSGEMRDFFRSEIFRRDLENTRNAWMNSAKRDDIARGNILF